MENIFSLLQILSEKVPLTLYVSLGGLIEELVAPIPSPLIMTSAGSIAHQQGHTAFYIVNISLLAAIGKTIGALVIYYLADKAEDIVLSKFGRMIGISHKEVESFGKRFNNTWKDDLILILLRAIPVFPGAPIAAVAGLIKLNINTYIRSTFIGVWIRSMIFGFIGYFGLSRLKENLTGAENAGTTVLMVSLGIALIYLFSKKRTHIQNLILKRTGENQKGRR